MCSIKKGLLETVSIWSMAVCSMGVFCYVFVTYLDMPDIYVSYSTKKCVSIKSADGTELGCDSYDAKQRYHHYWVP